MYHHNDDEDYNPSSDDGPEAELFRREAEKQAQWERFCGNRVEILLAEVRPYDAIRALWSFADMMRWKFRRTQGQFYGRS